MLLCLDNVHLARRTLRFGFISGILEVSLVEQRENEMLCCCYVVQIYEWHRKGRLEQVPMVVNRQPVPVTAKAPCSYCLDENGST